MRNESGCFLGIELLGSLCDDGGLVPPEVFSQLAKLKSDFDQPLEPILSIPHQLLLICFRRKVSFDIHPDGGALASGTRQPPDDTRSVFESDDLSLILADASIDRVGVVEVIGFGDLKAGAGGLGFVFSANERAGADRLLDIVDELLSSGGLDFFIVVAGEEGTSIDLVVSQEEIVNTDQFVGRCLVGGGEDVEPG